MAKFNIVKFDKDYHAWSDTIGKDFPSKQAAEEWCKKKSWTGYDYFVKGEVK